MLDFIIYLGVLFFAYDDITRVALVLMCSEHLSSVLSLLSCRLLASDDAGTFPAYNHIPERKKEIHSK